MIAKVQKWGNSQGLRLPKQVLDIAGISLDEEVELLIQNQQIVIQKISPPSFDLAELVAKIPPDYKAQEIWNDPPMGREVW